MCFEEVVESSKLNFTILQVLSYLFWNFTLLNHSINNNIIFLFYFLSGVIHNLFITVNIIQLFFSSLQVLICLHLHKGWSLIFPHVHDIFILFYFFYEQSFFCCEVILCKPWRFPFVKFLLQSFDKVFHLYSCIRRFPI